MMLSQERAPYGSKQLRVVLAALELYEFTASQVVKYANVDVADFDNAKRPGGPLAMESILVRAGEIRSGRGRSAIIYTFRTPQIFEEVREWVKSAYRFGETNAAMLSLAGESNEVEADLPNDTVSEENIQSVLSYLAGHDVEITEQRIWISRGFRYLADWANSHPDMFGDVDGLSVSSLNRMKYEVYRLRFGYYNTKGNHDVGDQSSQLRSLLTTILELLGDADAKQLPVEHLGFVEIGISVISDLVDYYRSAFEFERQVKRKPATWEIYQWEDRTEWLEKEFRERGRNRYTRWLADYWFGAYHKELKRLNDEDQQASLQRLNSEIPSLRDFRTKMQRGTRILEEALQQLG